MISVDVQGRVLITNRYGCLTRNSHRANFILFTREDNSTLCQILEHKDKTTECSLPFRLKGELTNPNQAECVYILYHLYSHIISTKAMLHNKCNKNHEMYDTLVVQMTSTDVYISISHCPWLDSGLPPRCPQVMWCH